MFNFRNDESRFSYKVRFNVILQLYKYSNSVAILEFTDEMNNKINIPTEITIYTNQRVIQNPVKNFYVLCWTDDYTIEYSNKVILSIKNNRTWDISILPNT